MSGCPAPASARPRTPRPPSLAQDEGNPSDAHVRACDLALARIAQSLTHDQIAALNLIAHAAAAASPCPNIWLDEGEVHGALTSVMHEEGDPEADEGPTRDFALIAFGVLTSLELREAADREADFCAAAVLKAQATECRPYITIVSEAVLYEEGGNQARAAQRHAGSARGADSCRSALSANGPAP